MRSLGVIALLLALLSGSAVAGPRADGLAYLERFDGGARPTDRVPLVVLLHGLGDRPESFAEAFPPLAMPARLVFLAAPFPYAGGFSWFESPPGHFDGRVVAAAADRVARAITSLTAARPSRGLAIVTGFSQGASLSFALAARHGDLVSLALPLSGRMPPGVLPASTRCRPARVIALHGSRDERIAPSEAEAAVRALKATGGEATLKIYPDIGHTLTPQMLADHRAALETALRQAAAEN